MKRKYVIGIVICSACIALALISTNYGFDKEAKGQRVGELNSEPRDIVKDRDLALTDAGRSTDIDLLESRRQAEATTVQALEEDQVAGVVIPGDAEEASSMSPRDRSIVFDGEIERTHAWLAAQIVAADVMSPQAQANTEILAAHFASVFSDSDMDYTITCGVSVCAVDTPIPSDPLSRIRRTKAIDENWPVTPDFDRTFIGTTHEETNRFRYYFTKQSLTRAESSAANVR